MEEVILLSNNDITKNTPLGGNIDVDKYRFCILDAQRSKIEELLGDTLYAKMLADFPNYVADSVYKKLYDEYLKPLLIHQSALEYINIGAYSVNNAGIFKLTPSNGTPVEKIDIEFMAQNQRNKAEMYEQRLIRWLCKNGSSITEYRCDSDSIVNPTRHTNPGQWHF